MENQSQNISSIQEQHTYTNEVTLEECKIIEKWIKDENQKNGKHMLQKTAEELFEESKNDWCCIIKHDNELIGCIFLMAVEKWWITFTIKYCPSNLWSYSILFAVFRDNEKNLPGWRMDNPLVWKDIPKLENI